MDVVPHKCSTIVRLPANMEGSQCTVKGLNEGPILPFQRLLLQKGCKFLPLEDLKCILPGIYLSCMLTTAVIFSFLPFIAVSTASDGSLLDVGERISKESVCSSHFT